MSAYRFWADLSHKAGTENEGLARSHARYILRPGECVFYDASVGANKQAILDVWTQSENYELKKRVDARFQSRFIVALPNDMTWTELAGLRDLMSVKFKDHLWTMAVHKGEKNKTQNLHMHFIFSDRSALTGKKDRTFITRDFLAGLKNVVRTEIARFHTITVNTDDEKRERLHMVVYQKLIREKARKTTGGKDEAKRVEGVGAKNDVRPYESSCGPAR